MQSPCSKYFSFSGDRGRHVAFVLQLLFHNLSSMPLQSAGCREVDKTQMHLCFSCEPFTGRRDKLFSSAQLASPIVNKVPDCSDVALGHVRYTKDSSTDQIKKLLQRFIC